MRIAFLGTGAMGAPMARNLARAGHEVRAWNRSLDKAQPLRDDGVEVAGDPAAAAEGGDLVVTMLADGDAVLHVAQAAELGRGQLWWQASTVGVEGIERCIALADESGVALVDAPVLGSRQPAEQGSLIVLASGPSDALEACAPAFEAVAGRTLRLGDAGAGTRLKLAVNGWVLAVTQATAETIALTEGLGLDPQRFWDAVDGGALDLPYARAKAELMADDEFPAQFSLALAAKDARLVREAAGRAGVDVPLAHAVGARFAEAVDAGLGDEDMAATYRLSVPRPTAR